MDMFSGIKEKLKEYVDTKLQLYQLTIEEKLVNLLTIFLYLTVLSFVGLLVIIFLMLLIAKIINSLTNNQFAGYGIVATLCLFLLWYISRPKNKERITSKIKEQILLSFNK